MPRGFVRVFYCCVALASLALTCGVLGKLLPLQVPIFTPKVDFFARHKNQFDTLFVGSSRFYNGISPRIFDATVGQTRPATSSFNAALWAMAPPESLMMVRRLVALHPAKLKRIFLEVIPGWELAASNSTLRNVYWRNLDALNYAVRALLHDLRAGPMSWHRFATAWSEFYTRVWLFARNEGNLGRGVNFFLHPDITPRTAWELTDTALGLDKDGFLPRGESGMSPEDLTKYRDALRRARAGGERAQLNPFEREEFALLARELAVKKIALLLVVMPTPVPTNAKIDAPADLPLFDFADLLSNEVFYREDYRVDLQHLNLRGAREFSRALGQQFAARYPGGQP